MAQEHEDQTRLSITPPVRVNSNCFAQGRRLRPIHRRPNQCRVRCCRGESNRNHKCQNKSLGGRTVLVAASLVG
jgi:hypothetical protein